MIPKLNYKKILIPIDGSKGSINAVNYSTRFASVFEDCSLLLLHVIDEDKINHLVLYQNENSEKLKQTYYEQGEKFCNRAIQGAINLGFNENNIDFKIVFGEPVDEILKVAPLHDLIVIPVRGKQRSPSYITGHITERIINLSPIPVLVVS
ncbi:MAG: universal stress protein [Promethearchaeota archaeon]